jgi:hypothetical protein
VVVPLDRSLKPHHCDLHILPNVCGIIEARSRELTAVLPIHNDPLPFSWQPDISMGVMGTHPVMADACITLQSRTPSFGALSLNTSLTSEIDMAPSTSHLLTSTKIGRLLARWESTIESNASFESRSRSGAVASTT